MNVLTKLYEKLFVPADVRKLLAAFRDGRLVVVSSYFKIDYDGCGLDDWAYVEIGKPGKEGEKNYLKIYYRAGCYVYKNGQESEKVYPKGYGRLFKVAYRKHLADGKASRLTKKQQALIAFNADIDEIFGDILND